MGEGSEGKKTTPSRNTFLLSKCKNRFFTFTTNPITQGANKSSEVEINCSRRQGNTSNVV